MKTFKLFNFNRRTAMVQADGCTKFVSSLCLILTMLFTLGVGEMWADHGFFSDDACGVKVNYSGSTVTEIKKNSSGASTQALGTISKLYLKEWWFAAWENTNDFTGSESGTMYYRIYLSGSASGSYTSSSKNYYNWSGWNNGSQNVWLGNNSLDVDLYSGKDPGNYIMEYYFMMGSSYLSNGSNNYKISFTVPGFSTTTTSKTFNNTTVSSTTDATISFTQHYGTALTTSNCALSGTNSSEFEVRSISETGVTVRFKPSSDGSKSATLTITDAHSKTCTITLSGTTQRVVTYNKGTYGTGSDQTAYKVYGTNLTLRGSGDFSRTCYDHTAWNTDASGTGGTSYALSGTYTSEATVTLYPTWTPQTYNITYKDQGGSAFSGTHGDGYPTTHTYGTATALVSPTKDHYTFDGWFTTSDCTGSAVTSIGATAKTADFTLYAKWTEITHAVRANTSTHATTNPSSWTEFGEVTGGTVSATSIATGYRFNGWSSDKAGTFADASSASTTFYPTKNDTWVTASIVAKTYSVTLDKNGGESNGSVTAIYNSNSLADFSGASYEGYSCDGYFTAKSGGTKIINADGTLPSSTVASYLSSGYWVGDTVTILYAQWTEDVTTYTLHYTYGTGFSTLFSSISAAKTSGGDAVADNASLASGTGVTLTATPIDHYKFVGWYSAAGCAANKLVSTDNPFSITMSKDTNLYAKAVLMTTVITLNKNGGSGSTPSTLTATHGSSFLSSGYVAPTRDGYTLSGWYTEESGGTRILLKGGTTTSSVSGYLDGSGNWIYTESTLTLYAHWTANTYKVTFDQQSGSGGSANVTATYNAAMPSATMPTRTGYDFNGYYGSTGGSGTKYYNADGSSAHVWDVANATTIYAYWTAHNYSITYSPSSAPTGCTYTTKPTSGTYGSTVTMVITPSTGYTVSVSAEDASSNTVTISNPSTNTYTFTQPASAVTVTVSASEIMRDITIVNGVVYGGSATSTTAGVATSAKITANDPDEGKKFTGWSLGTGVSLKGGYNLTDQTIEIYSTADATVTATYDDRNGVKMYFAKQQTRGWSNTYAYVYDDDDDTNNNGDWPGVELSETEDINCVTYYVYQYYLEGDGIGGTADGDEDWDVVIFNNGSSGDANQTANLTIADGHYYYKGSGAETSGSESAIEHDWYVKSAKNSWGDDDPMTHDCSIHTATISINLAKDESYTFKIYDAASNTWWSNSEALGNVTSSQTATTLYSDDTNNMKITADKAGSYVFTITKTNTTAPEIAIQYPSQFLVGSWDEWDEDDHLFDEYGYYKLHLTAGTYEFKVKYNGDWYGLTDATYTASIKDYLLYSDGGNMKITVATEGDYVFGWNGADKKLSIIFPNDQSNAQLTENRYLYFDSRNLGNPGWNAAAFSTRFWLKNYASGIDYSHVDCSNASVLEGGVYYALIPTGGKVGEVQLNRMKPDFSELWDYTSKVYAIDREDYKDNCLKEEEGNEDRYKNWTPEWKTYCPPIRTSTLSDNSTTKITWQSSGGAGTSENPYLVSTSHSIEVQGAATKALEDANMTINYDFKVGGSSQQASASNTYSHTSLSNNTTYTITMDSYNAYNGETGTKNTSATALYYKALDTYTVTNDLTNISSNGRSGAHAAAYNIAYSATLSVSAGYSLPTTITVKRGSTNITASCTYNSSTGALTIPAAQMTGGDITITAAGVAQPLTFTGATTSWSTASNWSPACVPTIEHDVTINKPAVVDIEHAAAKSIVLNQYSGNTGKLTIQANKGLEVEDTIRVKNAKNETVVTTPKDLILQSSSAGNASLIFDNTALDGKKDSATVQMYSKAEIPASGHWNWQYIGLPFDSANATYTYYGSYIHKFISNDWAPVANGETLYSWQGYSITNNSATTYEMEGELVSTKDDVEIELSYGKGKLIGNSWTAPIYIEAFETSGVGATFTSTPATIYLFNTGNTESGSVISLVNNWEPGQYISIPVKSASSIGIPYIAPMQGFWISADTKAGSVTLKYNELVRPASERAIVAGAMRAPKREQTERPQVMKIFATGAKYSDRVTILSREDFSRGFDNGWDGEKISFGEEAPSIYVINGQDSYDEVSSIPEYEGTVIGFRSGTNNMATISFDYDGEETLYLNDLRDQISALISNENTYEFSTSANDDEARFIISATPIMFTPTAVENNTTTNENKVQKIIFNDRVYIIRNGRMYDATGVLCK